VYQTSFRQLVDILTHAGGEGYWDRRQVARGYWRHIYQQVTVALSGSHQRLWNEIDKGQHGYIPGVQMSCLLGWFLSMFVGLHKRLGGAANGHRIFRRFIGFLDNPNIVLQNKPRRTLDSTCKQPVFGIGYVGFYRAYYQFP